MSSETLLLFKKVKKKKVEQTLHTLIDLLKDCNLQELRALNSHGVITRGILHFILCARPGILPEDLRFKGFN